MCVTSINGSNAQCSFTVEPYVSKNPGTLLSNYVTYILKWVIYSVFCQLIDTFGIITNIVNIIVFVKQGFKESTNISLLGLAISDLGCLVTLTWTNIGMTPEFGTLDLPFDPLEVQYLTGAMSHCTFSRITAWITALITFERCLCITAPLKVKQIITHRRVVVILVFIFLILVSAVAPLYVVNRFDTKFYPSRNKTIIGLVHTAEREQVEQVSFAINNVFIPVLAFLIIIICTVILVLKLESKTEWRKTCSVSTHADVVSTRNRKVARMIVVIAVTFILCFVPVSVIFLAMCLEPGLSVDGKYRNVLTVVGGLGLVLESINSSVNIFIYFNMSHNYRQEFRQIFCHRTGATQLFSTITTNKNTSESD